MPRNIVLCSDGTGNSGGKGYGTNVWWLYRAIDRSQNQIAFYDDGVGTEDNKYLRLVGGATGWGFTRNVKDLYKNLVRNYRPADETYPGDDIYLFGFSRGAYTVRALAAFILYCGIVKNGGSKSESDLDTLIDRLVEKYRKRAPGAPPINAGNPNFHKASIKCIGVWDTVSAIGVPFDMGLKWFIESYLFAFNFKDQNLSSDVDHGFHALAIDDERLSFHPVTWNPRDGVEQVWFAGVHSNVGGGYPKQGMAHVSLDWMMEKVRHQKGPDGKFWGLHFDNDMRNDARLLANVHDKKYDSRAGLAAYYRYRPRNLETLIPPKSGSQGTTGDGVCIHDSVFDRIYAHTLGYNPGNVPCDRDIKLVATSGAGPNPARQIHANKMKSTRRGFRDEAVKWVEAGKGLHMAFILLTLLLVSALLRLGFVGLFPESAGYDWIISAIFAIAIAGMLVATETYYRWPLCLAALGLLACAQFAPDLFGTPSGNPIAVWDSVTKLLYFLLPDQAAEIVVTFIAQYPIGAISAAAALAAIVWLKFVIDDKLAKADERICDTVRNPPIDRVSHGEAAVSAAGAPTGQAG